LHRCNYDEHHHERKDSEVKDRCFDMVIRVSFIINSPQITHMLINAPPPSLPSLPTSVCDILHMLDIRHYPILPSPPPALQWWTLRPTNRKPKIILRQRINLIPKPRTHILQPLPISFLTPLLQARYIQRLASKHGLLDTLISQSPNIPNASARIADKRRGSKGNGVNGAAAETKSSARRGQRCAGLWKARRGGCSDYILIFRG
jgi:hypothetical protein